MASLSNPNKKVVSKPKAKAKGPNVLGKIGSALSKLTSLYSNAEKGEKAAALAGGAGGYLFGERGRQFGRALGHAFTGITGMGDYKISHNTLLKSSSKVAKVNKVGDGIEVCHREFLFDLKGSVSFTKTEIDVNPGLGTSFPWLSQLSAYFEEYDMQGLVFEFVSTSGEVTAVSPALGSVVMSTEYNVVSQSFQSKVQAESSMFCTSGIPVHNMVHPVECRRASNTLNKYLTREGPCDDKRWYDMARTSICTQGMPSEYVIGEIWVSYHVILSKPRIRACTPGDAQCIFGTVSASAATIDGNSGTTQMVDVDAGPNLIKLNFKATGLFNIHMTWSGFDHWTYTNLIPTLHGTAKYPLLNEALLAPGVSGFICSYANTSQLVGTDTGVIGAPIAGIDMEAYVEVTGTELGDMTLVGFDGSGMGDFVITVTCASPKLLAGNSAWNALPI